MEKIKRKILLETLIDRSPLNYGNIVPTNININVFLSQTYTDMGLHTDVEPENNLISQYISSGGMITGETRSRLGELRRVSGVPYQVGFEKNKKVYSNFQGESINGVSKIFNMTNTTTEYTFLANDDDFLGTNNQTTGLKFKDTNETKEIFNTELNTFEAYTPSVVTYRAEGWHPKNTQYSQLTKEDKNLKMVETAKIQTEVFIERGVGSVLEKHFKLDEVNNYRQLEQHGNGRSFNVIRQVL